MSVIFLKRFLQRPLQVASIIPSSRTLIRRVASKMDFSQPRVIAEYGPGEGCHTREILSRMHPDSRLILFELDPELAQHLEKQFQDDNRVTVINADAGNLCEELAKRGHTHCDYIVSGIPFSILDPDKKRDLLRRTYESLAPHDHSAFIIYQVTNELVGHCGHFPRRESEYCLQNIPPMFVTKFYKTANGHAHANGANGHSHNGNGRHQAGARHLVNGAGAAAFSVNYFAHQTAAERYTKDLPAEKFGISSLSPISAPPSP